MRRIQVRYDRPTRTFEVWAWGLPGQRDTRVATSFRHECDAYQWINQNCTRQDRVYPTLHG
jgi:hypothetical protein